MKFADRLSMAWEANPVPKSRLANACKVSKGAVTQWFSGDTRPKSEAAMLLAHELGVSLEWLVLGKPPIRLRTSEDASGRQVREETPPEYHRAEEAPAAQVRQLPLLDWNELSRRGTDAALLSLASDCRWFPCARACGIRSFALAVQGDSMFPAYRDGEIIYVDPDASAAHNKDVVVKTAEGTSFKRLQLTPDGNYLLALNPDQPHRIVKMPATGVIYGVIIASYMER